MTDKQIKLMTERFLGWKLPEDFNPDAGISFKKTYTGYDGKEYPNLVSGTNLFNYDQAKLMVQHMVEGLDDRKAEQMKVINAIIDVFETVPSHIAEEDKHLMHWHYTDLIATFHDMKNAIEQGELL